MATTPRETTAPAAPAESRARRFWRDRTAVLALVSVVMMILGSLLAAQVHNNGGQTTITNATFTADDGTQISALVYTPSTATPQTPAPASPCGTV